MSLIKSATKKFKSFLSCVFPCCGFKSEDSEMTELVPKMAEKSLEISKAEMGEKSLEICKELSELKEEINDKSSEMTDESSDMPKASDDVLIAIQMNVDSSDTNEIQKSLFKNRAVVAVAAVAVAAAVAAVAAVAVVAAAVAAVVAYN